MKRGLLFLVLAFVLIFFLAVGFVSASNLISSAYNIGSYSQGVAGGIVSSSSYYARSFMGYAQPEGIASGSVYSAFVGFPPTGKYYLTPLPSIVSISPSNNYLTRYSSMVFNSNISSSSSIQNVSLYINGILNQTNSSGALGIYSFSVSGFSQGNHTWYLKACDTSGNCGYSSTFSFYVDLSPPSFSTVFPSNNTYTNSPVANFITNETDNFGLGNATLYLWNSTSLVNSSIDSISGTNNQSAFSALLSSDGTYLWDVYACDSAGNCAFASANNTIIEDGTNPLVSLNSPANNTNLSSNSVNFNSHASDNIAIANVSLYVDGSLKGTNSSGANNTNYTLTASSLADGSHTWYVNVCDKASNCVNSAIRNFFVDTTPPVVTITEPQAIYYGVNASLPLNYSVYDSGVGVSSSWYEVSYKNGTNVLGNTTLTGNTTFNVPGGGDYALRVWSNDTIGNANYSEVDFSVSLTGAVIVLNSPLHYSGFKTGKNALFNFTASGPTIVNCSIYTNTTGAWGLNKTFASVTSAVPVTSNLNLSNNTFYLWNVNCFDNFSHSSWALNNETFVVDNKNPSINNLSVSTTSGSKTISFTSVESDNLALGSCFYTIYNSTGGVDGSNNNVSFTCNSAGSATVSGYGNYNITAYAKDLAGNLNSTKGNFTTTAPVSSPSPTNTGGSGGGGGGGAAPAGGGSTNSSGNQTSNGTAVASVDLVNLTAGTPKTVKFNINSLGVVSFTITTKQDISSAKISLFGTDSSSNSIQLRIPGRIYQAFSINLMGINDSQISNVIMNLRVNRTWISVNHAYPNNVSVYRNPGSGWNSIKTTLIGNDSNYYYYTAFSPGFSTYVISAKVSPISSVTSSLSKGVDFWGNLFKRITPKFFRQTTWSYVFYYILVMIVLGGIVVVVFNLRKMFKEFKERRIFKTPRNWLKK